MNSSYDAIIVGAGASGIACAQRLSQLGVRFILIEARSRIGGRVFSTNDANQSLELGAEFIHGAPASTLAQMQRWKLPFYDVKDEHLYLSKGELVEVDFWEKIENIANKVSKKRKLDRSIHEFIHKHPKINSDVKKIFASFVEGFHAADTNLIGEKGFADAEESDDDQLNESSLFRLVGRYDEFLHRSAQDLGEQNIHLQIVLKRIQWKKSEVILHCEQGTSRQAIQLRAKKVFLTLPLGVLKSSAVEWSPRPEKLFQSLEKVHMGHVQKLIIKFRTRFWEKVTSCPVSYFHSGPEDYFPTWWSLSPLRTPHLIAWQGGPKALEMSHWSEEEKIHAALTTLSLLTKKSMSFLNAEVQSYHTHDWSRDPFSQGAYSYIGVDGINAAKILQKPIEETIYLAGEATRMGSSRATVHGAWESGLRAAERAFLPK